MEDTTKVIDYTGKEIDFSTIKKWQDFKQTYKRFHKSRKELFMEQIDKLLEKNRMDQWKVWDLLLEINKEG